MACLEAHGKIQRCYLLLDRFNYFRVAMAQTAGPQAGKRIIELSAICCLVVMAAGANNDPGVLFEIPVGRKRHPVGFQRCGIDTHLSFLRGLNHRLSIILDTLL